MQDCCKHLLEDFLKTSGSTVKVLVRGAKAAREQKTNRNVTLFRYIEGKKVCVPFAEEHFYLRGSMEYTNPQMTVEELQGVIGTRLLEACANYYLEHDINEPTTNDYTALIERLKKPSQGYIVPFLLNTDDVELDRYSMNPLKQSIIDSQQSATPAANAKTDQLKIDETYAKKYEGILISKKETDLITTALKQNKGSYLDFVDSIKYFQLKEMSELFGIDLSLYTLRMPLSTLQSEGKDGILHYIISQTHQDYTTVENAYRCMGRSMNKRTTLLTVPHSKNGYGSKRAARGKLHFEAEKFLNANVKYKTTALYPNDINEKDVAMTLCKDDFTISAEKLSAYSYAETPSSPQFFLYSIGSPEDAAIWHGVGAFGASELLKSYTSARIACKEGRLIKDLSTKYKIRIGVPLQFNLAPEGMWSHPIHKNIDASIGSIKNITELSRRGMKLEQLLILNN